MSEVVNRIVISPQYISTYKQKCIIVCRKYLAFVSYPVCQSVCAWGFVTAFQPIWQYHTYRRLEAAAILRRPPTDDPISTNSNRLITTGTMGRHVTTASTASNLQLKLYTTNDFVFAELFETRERELALSSVRLNPP